MVRQGVEFLKGLSDWHLEAYRWELCMNMQS